VPDTTVTFDPTGDPLGILAFAACALLLALVAWLLIDWRR
jgi:hypothetical protein